MNDLHVTFTRDGRVQLYDGEHQIGLVTKNGPFWQCYAGQPLQPLGKPSTMLGLAVASATEALTEEEHHAAS